jgi:hypothetical protein
MSIVDFNRPDTEDDPLVDAVLDQLRRVCKRRSIDPEDLQGSDLMGAVLGELNKEAKRGAPDPTETRTRHMGPG